MYYSYHTLNQRYITSITNIYIHMYLIIEWKNKIKMFFHLNNIHFLSTRQEQLGIIKSRSPSHQRNFSQTKNNFLRKERLNEVSSTNKNTINQNFCSDWSELVCTSSAIVQSSFFWFFGTKCMILADSDFWIIYSFR